MAFQTNRCVFCGASIPLNNQRCSACGNEVLTGPTKSHSVPHAAPRGPSTTQWKLSIVVILTILLLVGAILSGAFVYLLTATTDATAMNVLPAESQVSSINLTIHTTPAGANIMLNGSLVGTSPLVLQRAASENPITVEARLEGYRSIPLMIAPQQDQVIQLALERDTSPATHVGAEPILAPGSPTKTLAPSGQDNSGCLQAHQQAIQEFNRTKSAYDRLRQQYTEQWPDTRVARSQMEQAEASKRAVEARCRVAMEHASPTPSKTGRGYLSVNTRPWTKVYVDGRFIMNTPLMRYELPAGPHRLTLINEDRNIRETVDVRIEAGQDSRVIRDLQR